MHDVAMRRRPAALVIAAAVTVLLVSGALLFGVGKPAQAQSVPEPPCNAELCLDKTATPSTATVGEPITFTISERCPFNGPGCINDRFPLVDQLPSELSIDSVEDSDPNNQCTTSGNTVTCSPNRFSSPTAPFTLTIVATPTECGTFTNTANNGFFTATSTFTVDCVPTTKEQCKKGGFREFGYPDQGTCICDVNRRNRQ